MDIYSKDSNPIVSLFCCSDSSSFGHQELIPVGLHPSILALPYTLAPQAIVCAHLINFPYICPEINSFYWRPEFKSRPECWVCSLGYHCSQALRGQSKEIYVYTNLLTCKPRYTHVYLYICLCLYIKTILSSQFYVLFQSQHHKGVHSNLFLFVTFFLMVRNIAFIICNTVYQFICSILECTSSSDQLLTLLNICQLECTICIQVFFLSLTFQYLSQHTVFQSYLG